MSVAHTGRVYRKRETVPGQQARRGKVGGSRELVAIPPIPSSAWVQVEKNHGRVEVQKKEKNLEGPAGKDTWLDGNGSMLSGHIHDSREKEQRIE